MEGVEVMPERILWAEVLKLALCDFFFARYCYQRDTAQWFVSSSREVGSFNFCCDTIGLSASAIRKAISNGDQVALRKRLKRNPTPTRPAVVGLYDPSFECSEGRRVSACAQLRPMM
jgi:hypothetical protein